MKEPIPTPRTDAEIFYTPQHAKAFARTLERENAELRKERDALAQIVVEYKTDCGCPICRRVIPERDTALSQLAELKPCAHHCSDGNCPHDRRYRSICSPNAPTRA